MARYRFRRPSPIQLSAPKSRRQAAGLGAVGPGSEGDEGPKSPDSPASSPSTTGAPSPGDSSDSDDDEPPSPKNSSAPTASSQASSSPTAASKPTLSPSSTSPSSTSNTSDQQPATLSRTAASTTKSNSSPAFTQTPTSQGNGAIAPQITDVLTTVATSTRPSSSASPVSPASPSSTTSSKTQVFSSKIARPTQPTVTTILIFPPPPPDVTGNPVAENDPPRKTRPEPTLMSKGAEAAAITLSIFGAIALLVGILFFCKRRRRRRNEKREAELENDAANFAALRAPETAYVNSDIAPFAGAPTHMTQSSNRSNTLFGPGSYSRPETVSTNRNPSRIPMPQPTPNPFADPPLNKAYDVLAGRPRSTTLTDRGSWIKNPFKDPESERFDPFGELQAKARRERVKQVELARREAELERQFEEKEKMGLAPPERAMDRKGSGVTLEGLGVLDRSGAGSYR